MYTNVGRKQKRLKMVLKIDRITVRLRNNLETQQLDLHNPNDPHIDLIKNRLSLLL
jgi:hypothetical protein